MVDHRLLPGIEFVSCPGPLRRDDYWRDPVDGEVVRVVDDKHASINRVIPHVRALEAPEVSTETRADMEACAEVVVAVDERKAVRLCPANNQGSDIASGEQNGYGAVRWALMAGPEPWLWVQTVNGGREVEVEGGETEADAVLWAVEGTLPGGAE